MKISIVLSTYKRLETLEEILEAWLSLDQVGKVFLCDCSNKFETKLPIVHIKFNKDLGNKTMNAAALLTQEDFVILADDDIMPQKNLISDLYSGYKKAGENCLVGFMGRKFKDNNYLHTEQIWAYQIDYPVQVDMLGILYFTPRKYLICDLKGMENSINDLYWTAEKMQEVKKFVVPTKNVKQLSVGLKGLWTNEKSKKNRHDYYKELFENNYKNLLRKGDNK